MQYLIAALLTFLIMIGCYLFASEVVIDGSNVPTLVLLCISIGLSGYGFWDATKKKTISSWLLFLGILALIGSLLMSLVAEGGYSPWSGRLILITAGANIWSSMIELKKNILAKNK